MYNFWIVMKLEFRLIWHNWVTWLMVLVMLAIGALCASSNRNEPWGSWSDLGTTSFFISLMLAFCTGNQINRDRDQRLTGIVLSTPLATSSYVCGKYIAGLASLLLLAGSGLISAPVFYPPMGTQPYLIGWAWLALTAIVFGATFMLACITLTRGQRVIAYIAVLLLWVLPRFLTQSIPQLLDITASVFYPQLSLAPASHATGADPLMQFLIQHPSLFQNGPPPANLVQQVMHLSLAEIPPSPTPSMFLWNRLFFLGLSLMLLVLTIYGTHVMRRHA
jgi:ABC-type transport system involved in multi-copper enzyme maturation permease subunit